jgi:hypothetical protein
MKWVTLCEQVKVELELNWQRAVGHQQRHPIGVKLRAAEVLLDELRVAAEPHVLIEQGTESDEPGRALLCEELLRRVQP